MYALSKSQLLLIEVIRLLILLLLGIRLLYLLLRIPLLNLLRIWLLYLLLRISLLNLLLGVRLLTHHRLLIRLLHLLGLLTHHRLLTHHGLLHLLHLLHHLLGLRLRRHHHLLLLIGLLRHIADTFKEAFFALCENSQNVSAHNQTGHNNKYNCRKDISTGLIICLKCAQFGCQRSKYKSHYKLKKRRSSSDYGKNEVIF